MVTSTHHVSRPHVGIEHEDQAFRRAMTRALGSFACSHWTPGSSRSWCELDLAVVERAESAAQIVRDSPRATLLCWGRPTESPASWAWDGWLSRSLDAADAADVLLELIDSGLLARNHGPQPHLRPTFSK